MAFKYIVERNAIDLFNLLVPDISLCNLHTVLRTLLKVLTRRICLTIRASWGADNFFNFHDLRVDSAETLYRPIRCYHSYG